jgi:hypothetical protein
MCNNNAQQRALTAALLQCTLCMRSCMYLDLSTVHDCSVSPSVFNCLLQLQCRRTVETSVHAQYYCCPTVCFSSLSPLHACHAYVHSPVQLYMLLMLDTCVIPVLTLPQEALFSIVLYPAIDISQLMVATQHEELVRVLNLVYACIHTSHSICLQYIHHVSITTRMHCAC